MNTFDLSLDLDKRAGVTQWVTMRQGDHDGTQLRATIYDHGTQVSDSYTCRVSIRKPTDNEYYRETCSFSGSVAIVTIDEQYAAYEVGITYGYFELLQGTAVIASTENFGVRILQSAIDGAIVAPPYDSAIEDALAELDEATGRISQMVIDATAEYLEAHPELTTTVEDNSLTDAKLVQHGGILDRVARLMYRLDNLLTATPAESDSLTVTDAAKTPLAGLALYGRSTQDGTPTPDAPVPIVSVGPDSDGNISLLSKRTSDATQQSVTPVPLDGHELRSLPDGTRDEVTVDQYGHAVLTQRVGEVKLDGSENWSKSSTANIVYRSISGARLQSYVDNALCDHFAASLMTLANMADPSFKLGESGGSTPNVLLYFKSSTVATDVASIKAWLAENPTTLLYPLAEPVTIDLGTVDPVALQGPDMTAQAVPTAPFALTYERDLNVTLARLEASIAELATN